MSDFFGLRVALSALYAQRRGLDVTGHNVANANTEGYSRQRVGMASDAGPVEPALFSRWNGTGQGVAATSVQRLRDQFLEARGHQEHAVEANLSRVQATLARIELAFAEPGDDGLAAQLADLWAGWDDVANRPEDLAARAQLLERAGTVINSFAQADAALVSLSESSTEQLGATIADVNATAARVADLNGTIQSTINAGFSASDLMDQRDVLVDKLARLAGATVRLGSTGLLDVYVGGTALVRGATAEALQLKDGPAQVVWAKDQARARVGGDADGLLDSINEIIPKYRADLAAVAATMRDGVNAEHTAGVGLDGGTGRPFFVTAASGALAVNPDLLAEPGWIAAADAGAGPLDGSVAARVAETAAPDTSYRQMIVTLGVEAQTVNRRVDIQRAIATQVDAAREAEAGVNLDEEMTNMVAYQRAYEAAARFMTAVDQALDTLINGTGRVGR